MAAESKPMSKPNADTSINVTLMVNKKSRKILYAEAGKDFVDLLFSFLILPTGAIAKEALVSKASNTGDDTNYVCCITNLYNSVKSLSPSVMKADKAVLLDPKAVSITYTSDILPCIQSPPAPHESAAPRRYFLCNKVASSNTQSTYIHSISTECGTVTCSCGYSITREVKLVEKAPVAAKDPVLQTGYVKKSANFVITDDLSVMPVNSTATVVMLWNKLGLKEPTEMEMQNATVGPNEVMGLLKAAMVSHTALNDVFQAEDYDFEDDEDSDFEDDEDC